MRTKPRVACHTWYPRDPALYVERNLGWELLPDAMSRGLRWRRLRNLPGRRLRGVGNMAVLRRPAHQSDRRPWDRVVPFT